VIIDRAFATTMHRDAVCDARLPVIVNDPLEPLAPEFKIRALDAIARSSGAAQIVIVTNDDAAVEWARNVGDSAVLAWTADDARGFLARKASA
jgi:hypothetical protein